MSEFDGSLRLESSRGTKSDIEMSEENKALAAQLLLLSKNGNMEAAFQLSILYQYSSATKELSIDYLKLAASRGHATAQAVLGAKFNRGQDLKVDYNEAHRWFLLSATQGNSLGQTYLGNQYMSGQGVEKSNILAHYWLTFASEQMNPLATELLDLLTPELSDKDLIESSKLLSERENR